MVQLLTNFINLPVFLKDRNFIILKAARIENVGAHSTTLALDNNGVNAESMVKVNAVNQMQADMVFAIKIFNNPKVYPGRADNRINGAVYQKDKTLFPDENRREKNSRKEKVPWL